MSQAINLKTYKQAKNLADTVKAVENQTLNVIEVYREIEEVKKKQIGKHNERQISHQKSK